MKRIAFALIAILITGSAKADILANGDFHDGKAHWKGDFKLASDTDHHDMSSIDKPSENGGAVINLSTIYPKIYQTFNTHQNAFDYSLTFKPSTDYASTGVSRSTQPRHPTPSNYSNQRNAYLSQILGGNYSGDLDPPMLNEFLLIVVDMSAGTFSSAIIPVKPGLTNPQTVKGTMRDVPAHDEKVLFIVFGSGRGSVTLLNIAFTSVGASSNIPDSFTKP